MPKIHAGAVAWALVGLVLAFDLLVCSAQEECVVTQGGGRKRSVRQAVDIDGGDCVLQLFAKSNFLEDGGRQDLSQNTRGVQANERSLRTQGPCSWRLLPRRGCAPRGVIVRGACASSSQWGWPPGCVESVIKIN